ncbi:MAG TPA: hypothetical protein VM939_13150 [Gemmatimonadaceae bacterium]|nr:hypothetical protein [Gemmatimonadaceae bacterium]
MNASSRRFNFARVLNELLRAILVLSVIAPSADILAQLSPGSLREGQRVRIEATGGRDAVGVVKAIDADSLVLFTGESGATLSLATRDVRGMKVSKGRSMSAGAIRGMLWGAGISGGIALAIVPAGLADEEANLDGEDAGAFVAQMVAGGLIWGGAIGAFVKRERWESISLQPSVQPVASGLGIGFRVSSRRLH